MSNSEISCSEVWALYERHYTAIKVTGPQTQGYNWKNLWPHFGQLRPSQIDVSIVDGYQALRAAGVIGRPACAATVRRELVMLLAAMRWCARRDRKYLHPDCIPYIELPDPSPPRERWLRQGEVARFFKTAATYRPGNAGRLSRVERFCYIALETAARKQAILDLTWERVDFEMNAIHFDVPGRRRTNKRRAAVPMSKLLRKILTRASSERINNRVMDNPGAIWAPIQHIALKAGLANDDQVVPAGCKPKRTGISPHVFRHTAATEMVRRGVPLFKVAKVLGNSVRTVEQVYGHHMTSDLLDAVDTISGDALDRISDA